MIALLLHIFDSVIWRVNDEIALNMFHLTFILDKAGFVYLLSVN